MSRWVDLQGRREGLHASWLLQKRLWERIIRERSGQWNATLLAVPEKTENKNQNLTNQTKLGWGQTASARRSWPRMQNETRTVATRPETDSVFINIYICIYIDILKVWCRCRRPYYREAENHWETTGNYNKLTLFQMGFSMVVHCFPMTFLSQSNWW